MEDGFILSVWALTKRKFQREAGFVRRHSWYCSKECKGSDKMKNSTTDNDLKYRYTQGFVWAGVNDLIRRDAVRHNDGHMMVLYWKADLVKFFSNNHP
ncbi:hypothetical protein MAR_015118, partial [Mya arenaria]